MKREVLKIFIVFARLNMVGYGIRCVGCIQEFIGQDKNGIAHKLLSISLSF